MGRSALEDSSGDEDAKRRKVVLLRPEAPTAERAAPPAARRAGGGVAGHILAWIGQNDKAERRKPKAKPRPAAQAVADEQAAVLAPVKRKRESSDKPERRAPRSGLASAAFKMAVADTTRQETKVSSRKARKEGHSRTKDGPLRSASPCSPEPAARRSTKDSARTASAALKSKTRKTHSSSGVSSRSAVSAAVKVAAAAVASHKSARRAALRESAAARGSPSSCASNSGRSKGSDAEQSSPSPSPSRQARPPASLGAVATKKSSSGRTAHRSAAGGGMRHAAKHKLRTTAAADRMLRAAVPPAADPAPPPMTTQPVSEPSPQPQPAMASEMDEGTFQTTVLERLRSLCGEHDDAKVLAEYIVVMVAGNKGKEEMAVELKPFFQDQAQAESFVEWVEECKWKFLTGGPSPLGASAAFGAGQPAGPCAASGAPADKAPAPPPAAAQVPQSVFTMVPSTSAPSARTVGVAALVAPAPAAAVLAAEAPQQVRPGPHVAVTSRVVLQPNPHFASGAAAVAAPAPSRESALAKSSVAAPSAASTSRPAGSGTVFSKAAAASFRSGGVKQNKNELLESMTKQLQLILTKLNDTSLGDQMREKYQALAQKIQLQMAKISKPQTALRGPPIIRRRM